MQDHYYHRIPGWFDFEDIYREAVRRVRQSAHFVEIGCFLGKSSVFMAVEIANSGKAIQFDCVDTFEGTEADKHIQDEYLNTLDGTMYGHFLININPVWQYVRPVRMSSVQAAGSYTDDSLDLVFIDAAHDYDNVKADLEAWFPKVRQGGMFAGHDYDENWTDVIRAVDEFAMNNNFNLNKIGHSWLINKPKD